MLKIESVFIVGGSGGFGRRFAEFFRVQGSQVVTADSSDGSDLKVDVAADPQAVSAQLRSDLVLLCVDEASALQILPAISSFVGAGTLVVDICSVKSKICELADHHCLDAEYMSLHPMFGPEREVQGSNAVVIAVRPGDRFSAFTALLSAWGLNVIMTTCEEHDRLTAMVQVVPHALLLSFAQMRTSMEVSEELIKAFATPIFTDLEKVSQGLVSENPLLYHNIQNSNPHAADARAALLTAVETTLATIADQDPQPMSDLFARAKRD